MAHSRDLARRDPDVWELQREIARNLAAWGTASVALGTAAAVGGHVRGAPGVRAFGVQTAMWGATDLAIAGFAELRRRGRLATADDPHDPEMMSSEARSLRGILLVNAGLDVTYIGAGVAGLAVGRRRARAGRSAAPLRGHSTAVITQGAFLLMFDVVNARRVRGEDA